MKETAEYVWLEMKNFYVFFFLLLRFSPEFSLCVLFRHVAAKIYEQLIFIDILISI